MRCRRTRPSRYCYNRRASQGSLSQDRCRLRVRPVKLTFSAFRLLSVLFSVGVLFAGCASRRFSAGGGGPHGTVDRTRGRSAVCAVHHTKMHKQRSEIIYGLPRFEGPMPSASVRHRRFPFAETTELGGCVVSSTVPRYVVLYVCSECRRTEKAWCDANPQ